MAAFAAAAGLALVHIPCSADVVPSPQPAPTQPPPAPYVSVEEEVSPWYTGESGSSVLLNLRGQFPYAVNGQQYVIRVKIPYVSSAAPEVPTGRGDINLYYLAILDDSTGRWSVGPTMRLPTGEKDSLGSGKYSIGPAFGYDRPSGKWTLGFFCSNYFSVIGPASLPAVAQTKIDPSANLSLPRGWAIGTSSMSFTYNWTKGMWVSVPVGLRVDKAFGKNPGVLFAGLLEPLVASLSVEKNLAAAGDTPSWTFRALLRWNLPRRKN